MNTAYWTFSTRNDLIVIGQNPEMADYDNPRGDVIGAAWYVEAANDNGDTRELRVVTGPNRCPRLAAEALAERLTARMGLGKLPVGFDRWPAGRAIYGSPAWEQYGQDDEVALERREAAEEGWR